MNKKIVEEVGTSFAVEVSDKVETHPIMYYCKEKDIESGRTKGNLDEALESLNQLGETLAKYCKPVNLMDDLQKMTELVDQLDQSNDRLGNRIKVLNDFN